MATYNNLTDFKSQYELHKNMQMLTDALTQVQNAQGQPLIPNEEGNPDEKPHQDSQSPSSGSGTGL